MKIIAEISCDVRHCGCCEWKSLSEDYCCFFGKILRRTSVGVLRCKQCLADEQEYKKLDAIKTCDNCKKGPGCKCVDIRYCSRGWGDDDLWEVKE